MVLPYRNCPYPSKMTGMRDSWVYSNKILSQLNHKLSEFIADNVHQDVSQLTVVVAGSFGRLEAGCLSDLDYFIITPHTAVAEIVQNAITGIAKELNLQLPKKDGVFSQILKFPEFIDSIGDQKETLVQLAQRLLLLLESCPIYNEQFYNAIVERAFDNYFKLHKDAPNKEAVVLLNDLIKYFRHICINYQFTFCHENEKWGLRNIKLRHSRVIMYGSLLFLILNASKYPDKKLYIKNNINFTPIERIISVLTENATDTATLFECYNTYLNQINDTQIRDSLKDIKYEDRYDNACYTTLKRNSDKLQTFLTNCVLSEKEKKWSEKVVEYMIF